MTVFFENTYYGNTVGQWLLAFGLILLAAMASRLLYRIVSRGFRFITRKTRGDLDDILIDQIEEPIVASLLLVGIRMSIDTLTLSEESTVWIDGAYTFAFTLLIGWLISRLYNALHERYLVPLVHKTENDVDDMLLPMLKSGIKAIIWTLAIIVGLNNAGYNVGAVLAGLGLGGLAFALAAQDVVANFFGGITIFIQQPFKIGDEIIVLDPAKKTFEWLRAQDRHPDHIHGREIRQHLPGPQSDLHRKHDRESRIQSHQIPYQTQNAPGA